MKPIKLEKLITPRFKYIEWKLHNVCNYDCSFCGEEHKDGSNRWKDLDTYKMYVDKLVAAAGDMPLWIQFTGGEPTLYPKLIELFQYMKSKGVYTGMVTNGTRTLRWWEEFKESKSEEVNKFWSRKNSNNIWGKKFFLKHKDAIYS